jgi:DNA-binding SARP family transcriptional activator
MTAAAVDPVIHLIGGPYVSYGAERRTVPEGSKKLLAFVALRRCPVDRPYAAGALWPFGDDARAAGNLRSALWRLRHAGIDVVAADKWSLWLAEGAEVDVHRLAGWAHRLIRQSPKPEDLDVCELPDGACELLPGWYDEWAVTERERIRQSVLHALEALSRALTQQGRYAEAVEAALRAVAEEPLRESGQRALLDAHLGQGNITEVRRAYARFARLLRRELGVEPSRQITALLGNQAVAATSRPLASRG